MPVAIVLPSKEGIIGIINNGATFQYTACTSQDNVNTVKECTMKAKKSLIYTVPSFGILPW